MSMRLAYNTNGFPQHELADVIDLLGRLGYAGIAITPDTFHLHPLRDGVAQARALRARLADRGLAVAVETGARFVLDPRRKHWPTLLDEPADAERRLDLLRRCLDIAVELGAETFSFWSGRRPAGLPDEALLDRLAHGAQVLLTEARGSGVAVCFEPEPGMAVDSLDRAAELLLRLAAGADDRTDDALGLMLDVGHVPVTESLTPGEALRCLGPQVRGVQLDDSRGGVHEHLFFGDGEIDFADVAAALTEIEFTGLAAVELPRHDHDPVTTATRAIAYFRELGAVG